MRIKTNINLFTGFSITYYQDQLVSNVQFLLSTSRHCMQENKWKEKGHQLGFINKSLLPTKLKGYSKHKIVKLKSGAVFWAPELNRWRTENVHQLASIAPSSVWPLWSIWPEKTIQPVNFVNDQWSKSTSGIYDSP